MVIQDQAVAANNRIRGGSPTWQSCLRAKTRRSRILECSSRFSSPIRDDADGQAASASIISDRASGLRCNQSDVRAGRPALESLSLNWFAYSPARLELAIMGLEMQANELCNGLRDEREGRTGLQHQACSAVAAFQATRPALEVNASRRLRRRQGSARWRCECRQSPGESCGAQVNALPRTSGRGFKSSPLSVRMGRRPWAWSLSPSWYRSGMSESVAESLAPAEGNRSHRTGAGLPASWLEDQSTATRSLAPSLRSACLWTTRLLAALSPTLGR